MATFYAIPKIHKEIQPVLGRTIVSGYGNLMQGISIYVNEILCPFIRLLEVCVTPGTLLASLDVESLYTNIDHHLGIEAVKYFLEMRIIYFDTQ